MPRWAFMERFRIIKEDRLYLDRLRVVQTPLFGIYLHRIHMPDGDRDPHDHPWWFASLVLSGGYTEEVYDDPGDLSRKRDRVRNRFSLRTVNRRQAHQIVETRGALRTLVLTGRRSRIWGFWTPDGFVSWRDYGKTNDEVALWGGGTVRKWVS